MTAQRKGKSLYLGDLGDGSHWWNLEKLLVLEEDAVEDSKAAEQMSS